MDLPSITLLQKTHKKKKRLLITFSYDTKLIAIAKKLPNAMWSKTLRSWYIDYSLENILLVKAEFKSLCYINDKSQPSNNKFKRQLNQNQKDFLNDFYLYLKGKRYSKSTIQTYTFFIADFISFNSHIECVNLTNRDVEIFIEQIFIPRKYSISTQRQFISAMKLFINFFPHSKINNLELERPKKDKKLPNVLSQEEILKIIKCTQNLKHRTIIALIYSCGLRIGELINLKLADFHIERKQLIVKNGKGRKDRYVSLADSFLPLLLNYYNSYNPKFYFIEGQKGEKYSQESIRQFLKKSCLKANIDKRVTPHTLRHSYATHLLENGVDIRYIQSLLGHAKPETTMIYTHVKRKDLMDIQNPLDIALQKLKNSDKQNKKLGLSGNI
ncbi:tyrosine-type recombinase/integrase [Polaribacter marinivivus]|uniref:Tyrosine-type recombinase/integrase n=1 Tax=Polaribacter marinivivus TaxID=1524260 RepID=A0ABV8R5N3_9FLAO